MLNLFRRSEQCRDMEENMESRIPSSAALDRIFSMQKAFFINMGGCAIQPSPGRFPFPASRLFLLVESIISLRRLPKGSFQTVSWETN